jgi:hypothetical protein
MTTVARRQLRVRRKSGGSVDEKLMAWFTDDAGSGPWPWSASMPHLEPALLAVWERGMPDILRQYAVEQPGTRPRAWWLLSAPTDARERLGGVGDAWVELHPPLEAKFDGFLIQRQPSIRGKPYRYQSWHLGLPITWRNPEITNGFSPEQTPFDFNDP